MARKTITYAEIREIKSFQLSKMTKKELIDLEKKIRPKTETRLRQLDNTKGIYSPAAENIKKGLLNKSLNSMTKNMLVHDLQMQINFHKAKTSTVKGTREWERTQDIYIFGRSEKGLPKHRLNPVQRRKFWELFREFNVQHKNARYLIGYDKIQQFLGDMVAENRNIVNSGVIKPAIFEELMTRVEAEYNKMNIEEYEYEDDDIFSL